MMQLARLGFNVVPQTVEHRQYGLGFLCLNRYGLRFEDKTGKTVWKCTWEEFDRTV